MPTEKAFDPESAIRAWRTRLEGEGAIRATHIDELEGHLRDEMDALASAGEDGASAFAKAQAKLGSIADLVDAFARSDRAFAWRVPGLLFFAGVLTSILADAASALASTFVRLTGTTLHAGVAAGSVAAASAIVLTPLAFIALVVLVTGRAWGSTNNRPPNLWSWTHATVNALAERSAGRVGVVVGLGLVVAVASFFPFPSSLSPLGPEGLRVLNQWHAIEAPTARIVWRVLPFVLALGIVIARRRSVRDAGLRETCWALMGFLTHALFDDVSFALNAATLIFLSHADATLEAARGAVWVVDLGLPIVLMGLGLAAWRRLPTPHRIIGSRWTELGAIVTALVCLALSFSSTALAQWSPRAVDLVLLDVTRQVHLPISVVHALIAPTILGVLVMHLRALVTSENARAGRSLAARS